MPVQSRTLPDISTAGVQAIGKRPLALEDLVSKLFFRSSFAKWMRFAACARILVPLLSNNQKQLCHILNNMQEHVLPWNSMDIFVFSPENEALWELECPQAVVHCNAALDPTSKPCDVNNTEVFFMPLREEWRTPQEAGDSAFWLNTFWDEGYRRMVSTTSCELPQVTY